MKGIRLFILSMMIFIAGSGIMYGQALGSTYKAAVGLRAGETSGITFKLNTNANSGFEIIGGIWSDWFSITGLYEKRAGAFNVEGMNWYYGAGGHVSLRTSTYYNEGRVYERGDQSALGIDGTVGLEYKIPQIPFAISLDIKPFLEINRVGDMYLSVDPGLGVKFTF